MTADNQTTGIEGQIQALSESLSELRNSISTRYLGSFPGIFKNVCECLEGAKNEILVMCDWPGYGHFSEPDLFQSRYQSSLIRLARRARIVCVSPEQRYELTKGQFGDTLRKWPPLGDKEEFESRLRRLPGEPQSVTDGEGFFRLLCHVQSTYDQSFNRDLDYRVYPGLMPYYAWIVDNRVAVFSMLQPEGASGITVEHGFVTQDAKLVQVFAASWQRFYDASHALSIAVHTNPRPRKRKQ